MNKIFTLLLFLVCYTVNAQKIHFEYDIAGNQIKRELCPFCDDKISEDTPPKEISDLKEEDLQKFFPEDIISYYPNPVKELLYLKWQLIDNNKVSEIQFYSLDGQLVKRIPKLENTDNQTINFQNLPTGVYSLLLIFTNGDEKSIKIIKE